MDQTQTERAAAHLTSDEEQTLEQGREQDNARALQEGMPDAKQAVQRLQPTYPNWPTSRPGPQVKQPPPGMRSINSLRPEQMAEIGYNQETGEPSTSDPLRSMPDPSEQDLASFDQQVSASTPEGPRRRKERL